MKKRGIATPTLVVLMALLLVGGGVVYVSTTATPGTETSDVVSETSKEMTENAMEDGDHMAAEESIMTDESGSDVMTEGEMEGDAQMMMEDKEVVFDGTVLAGDISPLLDFNQEDYKKAIESKKVVVLYFYAKWCPNCKAEFPKMQTVFDELNRDDVIGFRVNFNDNDTDSSEEELAREFGVAYQHTKVILKDGERVLKSPETWNEGRYRTEINSLTQ